MVWTHSIHEGHNGNLLQANVRPIASSGDRVLNGVGQGTHTFQLQRDDGFNWKGLLGPLWNRIIVAAWDGVPKYAGYIHSLEPWDRAKQQATIRSVCVRDFLSNRFLYPANPQDYPNGTRSVTARSHAATLRKILLEATQGRGGEWNLPLVLPDDGSGPIDRTWWFYELWTAERAFTEIQNLNEGPDVDFEPRYRADGGIEWVVRTGSPHLESGDFEFNLDAPEQPLSGVRYRLNGQDLRTGSIGLGKGSEASMRVGFAYGYSGSAAMIRDRADSYKDIDDQADLDDHAISDLVTNREPIEQWAYTMRAEPATAGGRDLAQLRLGDRISLHVRDDLYIPDSPPGGHQHQVIAYRWDLSGNVPLTVQKR
ncbi:hypothetical protein [Rathayibacter sp. AY2B5]|uniref:hypothetical protein n=1 Tax=Rathayibacter sp. AY2B5 TaxID=2080570 RepID=UPI000CE77409|nr:hypothetical protein [Rathayibacter sp. AY2B5]PPG36338.1 hypothetical protein C5C30_16240 [Rathayibacter sp. AY2B5]